MHLPVPTFGSFMLQVLFSHRGVGSNFIMVQSNCYCAPSVCCAQECEMVFFPHVCLRRHRVVQFRHHIFNNVTRNLNVHVSLHTRSMLSSHVHTSYIQSPFSRSLTCQEKCQNRANQTGSATSVTYVIIHTPSCDLAIALSKSQYSANCFRQTVHGYLPFYRQCYAVLAITSQLRFNQFAIQPDAHIHVTIKRHQFVNGDL